MQEKNNKIITTRIDQYRFRLLSFHNTEAQVFWTELNLDCLAVQEA